MDIEEKKKIALRMTIRASSSIKFVRDYLASRLDTIGEPYLRSLHILLSFAFELILKSRLVVLSSALDIESLRNELRGYLHNFVKIYRNLRKDELDKIGIKNIISARASNNYTHYIIETIDGKKIFVEDFNDIRYDFIDGKLRLVSRGEHRKIKEYAEVMIKISNEMYNLNNSTGNEYFVGKKL